MGVGGYLATATPGGPTGSIPERNSMRALKDSSSAYAFTPPQVLKVWPSHPCHRLIFTFLMLEIRIIELLLKHILK